MSRRRQTCTAVSSITTPLKILTTSFLLRPTCHNPPKLANPSLSHPHPRPTLRLSGLQNSSHCVHLAFLRLLPTAVPSRSCRGSASSTPTLAHHPAPNLFSSHPVISSPRSFAPLPLSLFLKCPPRARSCPRPGFSRSPLPGDPAARAPPGIEPPARLTRTRGAAALRPQGGAGSRAPAAAAER